MLVEQPQAKPGNLFNTPRFPVYKFRTWETLNVMTDADGSTDTTKFVSDSFFFRGGEGSLTRSSYLLSRPNFQHALVPSVSAVSRAGGYRLFKLSSNRPGDQTDL